MICQLWDNSKAIELNIPHDDKHSFYSWKGCVYFSAVRQGNTFNCHIAANKSGKRHLRQAVRQFCQYMFSSHWWCKYISANVSLKNKSVANLVVKCGFVKILTLPNSEVYICHS